jgi:hypothetical protein
MLQSPTRAEVRRTCPNEQIRDGFVDLTNGSAFCQQPYTNSGKKNEFGAKQWRLDV